MYFVLEISKKSKTKKGCMDLSFIDIQKGLGYDSAEQEFCPNVKNASRVSYGVQKP